MESPFLGNNKRTIVRVKQRNYSSSICKRKLARKFMIFQRGILEKPYAWSTRRKLVVATQKNSKISTQHRVTRHCADCSQLITIAVFEFSMKNFGIPLCRNNQPYTERRKRSRSSTPTKLELSRSSPIEIGGKYPEDKKYYNGY